MATETLPEKIGPYQVVGLLGKGGMGSVYKAFKPPLRRYVAVKIIKAEFVATPGALERFRREAELASVLKHPNIVTVFDYEEIPDGDSYIVTELIEGGLTLRDRLSQGALTLEEISDILKQAASALDYAYESAHIVHRDIKPSNIFLEAGKRVALGDFGIAKDISSNTALTSMNQGVGTPDYMSPEQAMGEPLDRRSDIYSLGVVLYEMLVGTVPFKGDTPISVVMAHIQKPVPQIRQHNPNLSSQLQSILDKALAKKKEDRFATAGQLSEAFAASIKQGAAPAGYTSPAGQPGYQQPPPTQVVSPLQLDNIKAQLALVDQFAAQGRYQEAFDRLEELHRQQPYDSEISRRHQEYLRQGYVYKASGNTENIPRGQFGAGPLPQQSGPYSMPNYMTTGSGPALTPARKKSSPLPLVLGAAAALVVVGGILLFILLSGPGTTQRNATATAQAIAAITTAPPATPSLAPTPTVPPVQTATVAPTTRTALTPSVAPAARAEQLAKEGEALFNQSSYRLAIDKYLEAIKLDPNVARYYEYVARGFLNLEQYRDMEEPSRKMVELEPGNPAYQYYLGVAFYETDRAAEAEKYFREAVRLRPNEPLYHRYVANVLIDLSRLPEAETSALKAIELNPAQPENHNALGRAYQAGGKYVESEKEFRTALSQNSTSAIYQYNISLSLSSQNRFKEAEEEARKAIKLDARYASPYSVLSVALRNQERNQEALEAAAKGAELDPRGAAYPTQSALALLNLKRYPEAEVAARRAVQLSSTSAVAHNALGDALYAQDKFREALNSYTSAVNNFSRSHIYLTNQANAYARLNDYVKARDAYNKALAIKADYKPALDGLEAIKNK